MIFTDIRVQQYRSYLDSSFELGSGVNIVVGPNAIGKTNLLEALMLTTGSSSYRSKDEALVRHGKEWARVDAHTDTNQTRTVKLQTGAGGKVAKSYEIEDKLYLRFPVSQRHPVVLFEPNDLFLLSAEPGVRRNYFDEIIAKYEPGYDKLIAQYRRIVSQRNALLKQGPQGASQLFAWNLRLCDTASQVTAKRVLLTEELNKKLAKIYSKIANKKTDLKLKYISKIDTNNYSTSLLKRLETTIDLDLARGFTGSGPHREDVAVYFANIPAVGKASRGEVRTLLLALKILELEILEQKIGKRPLLLLDDVFSELDGARRRALTEYLHNYQTLITTTDADVVVQHFTENTTVIPIG